MRAFLSEGKGKREDGKMELRIPRDSKPDAEVPSAGRVVEAERRTAEVGAAGPVAAAHHTAATATGSSRIGLCACVTSVPPELNVF